MVLYNKMKSVELKTLTDLTPARFKIRFLLIRIARFQQSLHTAQIIRFYTLTTLVRLKGLTRMKGKKKKPYLTIVSTYSIPVQKLYSQMVLLIKLIKRHLDAMYHGR